MTRRRVARRRLIAEWAARANRWFGGDTTGMQAVGRGVDQVAEEDAVSELPGRRLPFELLETPPVAVANPPSNGNGETSSFATAPASTAGEVSSPTPAALPAAAAAPPIPEAQGLVEPADRSEVTGAGEADFNLGLAAFRRGRWREAVTHLRRAIELDGGRAAAHFYLGEALNHVDDLPGALQAYQRSVELLPSNPKALYGMGIVLDRMNRPDDAAPLYRRSRELQSK